jgi:hypothetical protein
MSLTRRVPESRLALSHNRRTKEPMTTDQGAKGGGWENWKIAHVGEEKWRTGEGTPPVDVEEIVSRLSETGDFGDYGPGGPGGFCIATEVCEPGEIVFGPITIKIQKCRTVLFCSGPMPM